MASDCLVMTINKRLVLHNTQPVTAGVQASALGCFHKAGEHSQALSTSSPTQGPRGFMSSGHRFYANVHIIPS